MDKTAPKQIWHPSRPAGWGRQRSQWGASLSTKLVTTDPASRFNCWKNHEIVVVGRNGRNRKRNGFVHSDFFLDENMNHMIFGIMGSPTDTRIITMNWSHSKAPLASPRLDQKMHFDKKNDGLQYNASTI